MNECKILQKVEWSLIYQSIGRLIYNGYSLNETSAKGKVNYIDEMDAH